MLFPRYQNCIKIFISEIEKNISHLKSYGNLLSKLVYIFSDVISCGNSIISPQCSLCPNSNGRGLSNWCSGNCEIEKSTGICTEKCRFPKKCNFLIV